MSKHFIYLLGYNINGPEYFYVGHTNDPERREAEHKRDSVNPDNPSYDTAKYRFIRELNARNIPWTFTVAEELTTYDQDGEYEWILTVARENEKHGVYYDGYPLTNQKAGDFTDEILGRTDIRSREQIREYRLDKERREQARTLIRTQQNLPPDATARKILEFARAAGAKNADMEQKSAEKKQKRQRKQAEMISFERAKRNEYVDRRVAQMMAEENLSREVATRMAIQEWILIQEHEDTKGN
jgi:hypothetical protein